MNLPVPHERMIAIGEAFYSPAARELVVADQEQRLEPRLAHLLETLCARPGEVIDRDTLLEEVWGEDGSDEALTQAISRLRQLLGDRSLIRTEPRKGYRLMAEPREVEGRLSVPGRAAPRPGFNLSRDQRMFAAGMLAGAVLCAVIAALLWPQPVTIMTEITQRPGEDPISSTTTCDGTAELCEGRAEAN